MPIEPTKPRIDRILNRGVWALALLPLVSYLAFWSLVLRARIELGYWPYAYHPDPKDIGPVHYLAYFYVTLAAVASPLVLPVVAMAVWVRRRKPPWRHLAALLLCVGTLLGVVTMYRLDPWGFSEWIAD